jgi:hypothetical protein
MEITLIQRLHKAIKLTSTNTNSLQYCFKDVLICLSNQHILFFDVRDINQTKHRGYNAQQYFIQSCIANLCRLYSLILLECTILAELLVKEFSSVSEET